jgi:hypothetical protein
MRHWQAVVLALGLGPFAGCLCDRPGRNALAHQANQPFPGLIGDDVVQMEIVLLERPVGDAYLNGELWALVDENGIENRGDLDANGFRVGQIGGSPPDGLQAMLLSERCNVDPRRIGQHAGTPRTVTLGQLWGRLPFRLKREGRSVEVEHGQAQCLLEVVPELVDGDKVRLRFTPQVRHGDTALVAQPVLRPSGEREWNFEKRQPVESFHELSWELTLSPNEYALVGTRYERQGTLGHRCFLNTEETTPVQRLLVIRCARSQPGPIAVAEAVRRTPALALQANLSSYRATAP